MRIGFDAKWFHEGPPSGRSVVRNLLEHLVGQNESNQFFVFLDRRHQSSHFPFGGPNVHPIHVWADNNLISNVIVLPVVGRKLNLDVGVFQNFVPIGGTFKRIAFIHDAIFSSNPEYFTIRERLYFSPMRILAHKADRICTVSESEKKRLVREGFAGPQKVDVVYNGVSERFSPALRNDVKRLAQVKAKYNLPSNFILYVGRLNQRKNLDNLLDAINRLNPPLPLIIVGHNDHKMFDLREMIRNANLQDRVRLVGHVPDEDLPLVYALGRILCYVSLEEGFGLPPIEAMASGLPVVVSDLEVLRETCGEAGTYVDPRSPDEIRKGIETLIQDPVLVEDKRQAGLRRAQSYTWDSAAKSLLDSVKSAMNIVGGEL